MDHRKDKRDRKSSRFLGRGYSPAHALLNEVETNFRVKRLVIYTSRRILEYMRFVMSVTMEAKKIHPDNPMSGVASRSNRAILVTSSFQTCVFAVTMVLCFVQSGYAQWEWMTDFHATSFTGIPPVASNEQRIVGVHRNKEVYESSVDSIYWRLLTVLPRNVAGGSNIRGIHLSPENEIYIVTRGDVYRYNESLRCWQCLTEALHSLAPRQLSDIALYQGGIILLSTTSGTLYRSMDDGATWEWLKLDWVLALVGNTLQYSPEGTLYLNSWNGLLKSSDHGSTVTPVVPGSVSPMFDAMYTYNTYFVINDSTIHGMDSFGDVWTLDIRTPAWLLLRKNDFNREYVPKFGVGAGGVLYYMYARRFASDGRGIEWSTDGGVTWIDVLPPFIPNVGWWYLAADVLLGDTNRVILYEHLQESGEIYEVDLSSGKHIHRAAPIARASGNHVFQNKTYLGAYGKSYWYFFDKMEKSVRPLVMTEQKKAWFKDSHRMYIIPLPSFPWDISNMTTIEHAFLSDFDMFIWGAQDFVIDSQGDILSVAGPFEYGVSRHDSLGRQFRPVSPFNAIHTAINRFDEFIVADGKGAFEYFDADDNLLSKGQLAPFMDSVRSMQNDTQGRLVFLGITSAYYSDDYGMKWSRSQLPNNGSAMRKVIVDHRDYFYAMDSNDGIYWSRDGGANFTKMPIDFDSLFCSVTDIVVDEEYLYCSTSGCGVYRMTLPSLNGLDSPRPVARAHEPINLYSGSRRHVTIDVPFGLDGATLFRMTDLSGRVIYEAEYTVDIPRARITLDTESLSNGVYPFMISSLKEAVSGRLMIQR
jgi:hypothetical protein